jgi:hypothetical protein
MTMMVGPAMTGVAIGLTIKVRVKDGDESVDDGEGEGWQ